jgi:phospholipase/carboxylesterase
MKLTLALILIFLTSLPFQSQNASDSIAGFHFKISLPKNTDKSSGRPAIILLHGYGSNEDDLFAFHQTLPEKYVFISVRAPHKIPNQDGYAWYELSINKNTLKHHVQEAAQTHKKLSYFISAVQKKYKLDSTQSFVMGYSQGGIMAWMQCLENKNVSGGIILSSYLPEEFYSIPNAKRSEKIQKYIFVAHGYSDNVITFDRYEKTLEYMKKFKNLTIEKHEYEMPHAITGQELNDIRAFLKKIKKTEK